MTRSRALTALVVILAFSAGFADVRVFQLGSRLTNDEHRTCVIQAQGLPAGHQLATSMADIHALLIQPPTSKAQRQAASRTPLKVKRIVKDLNVHLSRYASMEAKQPATRRCS